MSYQHFKSKLKSTKVTGQQKLAFTLFVQCYSSVQLVARAPRNIVASPVCSTDVEIVQQLPVLITIGCLNNSQVNMKGVFVVVLNILTYVLLDEIDYRLPKNVVPTFYNITMFVNMGWLSFQGYTEITVSVLQETNTITMHAFEIYIVDVDVMSYDQEFVVSNISLEEETEFLILHFDNALEVGEYTIAVNYHRRLNEHNRGFFRSNYTNYNWEERHLAVTHFQPMDARRAFPCFDEPSFKANFSISVVRDKGYISVSNMPLLETTLSNGRFCDTFETTPKISTYLVAFSVNDFTNTSYPRGQIYFKPLDLTNADYAAEISSSIISTMENYIGTALPVKKLDMIAIPHFPTGGMENLGLIAYIESHFLYVEETTRRNEKQITFLLIIHEVVHQWFGDLVTPSWWNHIWLNEGLAQMYQYIIGDEILPGWRLKDQLAIIEMREAVAVDGLETARPMSMDAKKPREFEKFFDAIIYYKAAAVLFTLLNAVGEGPFKATLQVYVKTYSYSTVSGYDLWKLFQDYLEEHNSTFAAQVTVPVIMRSWEHQAGIPVLNVNRNYESGLVAFTQERFLLDKKSSSYKTLWYIPINFATTSNTTFDDLIAITWLEPSSNVAWEYMLNSEEWLIVNKQASFYYLVNYDERNWKLIASALETENFGNIPALTRARLWNDAFSLARSGRLKYSVALELTKYLKNETDYIVLNSFFYVFGFFYTKFTWLNNFHFLQAFIAEALEPALEQLGIEENNDLSRDNQHIDTLNRIQIIRWSCLLGSQLCRNLTADRLRFEKISSLSEDLKGIIVCGGVRDANLHFWREVSSDSISDIDQLAEKALGCVENETILELYVQEALQQHVSVFSQIHLSGKIGTNFVFMYITERLNEICESLAADEISEIIIELSSLLSTNEHLSKLQQLSSNSSSCPNLTDALSVAITTVKSNMNWVNLYSDDISSWIRTEFSDGEEPTTAAPRNVVFIVSIICILVLS